MFKAILSIPLIINVSQLASHLPEFRYRGPFNCSYPYQVETSEFIINDANWEKRAVLFFNDKIYEGFTSISSDYPTPELAAIFTGLPQELAEPLTTSLKTTKLELPSLSASELADVQRTLENEKEKYAELKKNFQSRLEYTVETIKKVDINTLRVDISMLASDVHTGAIYSPVMSGEFEKTADWDAAIEPEFSKEEGLRIRTDFRLTDSNIELNAPALTNEFDSFGWRPTFFASQVNKEHNREIEECDDACIDKLLEI